ncbi:MAG TPA: FIST N-terminal domain-containing protein [Candidatus Omnitrophota bacterium]|nr:FIST N-terminal domain-containing protein [Candidatus Omnitrophota bacterium]HPD84511.1 FIST N-terminal domain-containing protein [Candidatus Omnitrophota bacterium]HRZ03369.1 FIST N-terminal domain-containing protein [Candidatus Omnitrophota bacterium]
MATHIGVGFSREKNTAAAAREASYLAKTQLKQPAAEIAVIFASTHYNPQEILPIINQSLGNPRAIGCSTGGIILAQGLEKRGVAVLALSSDEIRFGAAVVHEINATNAWAAGTDLARNAVMDFGEHRRQTFILLFDGLLKNNSPLIRGAQEILGKAFPVIGAGSSDNFSFKETRQYFKDKAFNHTATALLLGGAARIGIGSDHGWRPLGKPRLADNTENNIIKTIDGKKASGIYAEYFNQDLKGFSSNQPAALSFLYPLGIRSQKTGEDYILLAPIGMPDNGNIICQGDVPKEAEIHVMIGKKDFCKQAAYNAASQARDALAGVKPKVVIIFESMARQKLLGRETIQEIQIVRDVLGLDVPLIGMCSYGEIAPLKTLESGGEAHIQNGNIVILALA